MEPQQSSLQSQTNPSPAADWHSLAAAVSTRLISLSSENMDAGIEQVLAQVAAFSGDDRALIILYSRDGESMDTLYELCVEGVDAQAHRMQGRPAASLPWLNRQIREGRTVVINDVGTLPPEASLDQEEWRIEKVLSLLMLPMRFQDKVVGILGFNTVHQPRAWSAQAQTTLQLIADLLTNALARKQAEEDLRDAQQLLEKRVEERSRANERRGRAANALRDILQVLNSRRALPEVLDYIVVQSCKLLNASATLIRKADLEHDRVTTDASYQMPVDFDIIRDTHLDYSANDLILMSRRPVLISDLQATYAPALDMLDASTNEAQAAYLAALLKHFTGMLAVPLFIRDEIFGSLTFFFKERRAFSEEDIQLALALGDQAALAIENARLRSESEQNAVLMERNRLARDLHDAVTQTLFSASLIAEVLPRIWQRNPEEGWRRLEELRQLSRGALAEMRTLLLELRPSALTESKLSDLLKQLGEAVSGRARLTINLTVENEFPLHPDVQVFFYRIAQEALNNILKHDSATQVNVSLLFLESPDGRSVHLAIEDNGSGFDPAGVPPSHLGLGIMRERAQAVNADFLIISTPGQGTRVEVVWKE